MASDWDPWPAVPGYDRPMTNWSDESLAPTSAAVPLASHGAVVDPGGARQVVLGGRDTLWLVTGAPLDLFAVDTRDRSPWQFLGLVQPGALVVGSSRMARHVLAGHPHTGCTLRRVPIAEFLTTGQHMEEGRSRDIALLSQQAVVNGIDHVLTVLHQAVPTVSTPETKATTLGPGATWLRAGERASCPDGVCWVVIERGRVRSNRGRGDRDREAGETVPITPGEELHAVTDAKVTVYGTEDVLRHGQLWQHLVWHQETYLYAVDEWIADQRAERDRLMSAGPSAMDGMVARADETLRAVVMPATVAAARQDTDVAHSALAAVTLVAKEIGTEISPRETSVPSDATDDPVTGIAESARMPTRRVSLEGRWWRQSLGPLVGYLGPDRRPVALLRRQGGYIVDDVVTGSRRVTENLAAQIHAEAIMLYRPLPDTGLNGRQLLWFALRGTRSDLLRLFVGGLTAFLLGLGVPVLTGRVLGDYVPRGRADLVVQACVAVLVAGVVGAAFNVWSSVALVRLTGRLDATLQASMWDRLLKLPMSFHARFSTGELANAAMGISTIRSALSGIAGTVFTATMMAVANTGLLLWYDPLLGGFTIALVIVHTVVFLLIRLRLVASQRQLVDLEYKLSNQVFQTLRGLPKLRVAAAEGFAYAHWGTSFARNRKISVRFRTAQGLVSAIDLAYVPFSAFLLYLMLRGPAEGNLSIAEFLTFMTAFGITLTAMTQITTAVAAAGSVAPIFDKVRPLLEERPEVAADSTSPGQLSGDIELVDVSFRYAEDGQAVLRDVNLHIRSGEFVAVVGATGCGKSTLLRLLIRFNRPTSGSVRYDGVDLNRLDVGALRRQCGIVLQNSAPFAGTILTNIHGPGTYTMDEAWEAARVAGLDEDIQKMPMGMQTLLSDGAPELSGGQRQRLMIAQALIRKPRILFFDEATSALDNTTQAIVAESTKSLSVTRVVIAHRLSTVMHADRIVVMSEGRIVEAGSPSELLANEHGLFHRLVQRQRH